MSSTPTQVQYPRRATIRSGFQAFVGACVLVPSIVAAVDSVPGVDFEHGPAWAVAGVAVVTGTAAAVTRVMAIPGVNEWIARYAPLLAPEPKDKS